MDESMDDAVEGSWGQLVSITDVDSSPFPLVEDKFTIGRAKDSDISLPNNKLVSGRHCHIEKDSDGRVWLCDTSTNGTLLNVTVKITKGNKRELSHGDEFFVVYKKDEDDINVGYMYQNLEELQKEMDATQEYSSDYGMEATLLDISVNIVEEDCDEQSKKRLSEEPNTSTSEPPAKRLKTETSKRKPESSGTEAGAKDIQGEKTLEDIDGLGKTKDDQGKTTVSKKDQDSSNKSVAGADACMDGPDEIEEALICTICQELLHDCISLQPCMHSFCAGCYSDWMDKSNECPTCRMKVERINKNHIVNNLMEAYLKENPSKKRDEEDIKELDAKNKISRDMLYPGRRSTIFESSDSDRSDSPSPPPLLFNPATPLLHGFGTPFFGTIRPAKTVCRQCPDYIEPASTNTATTTTCTTTTTAVVLNAIGNFAMNVLGRNVTPNATTGTDDEVEPGPSGEQPDPDVKVMPTAPHYRCAMTQTHMMCQCCLQPMPDRRAEYNTDPLSVPPQQCRLCYRSYCHAYWGCKKVDCNGCIGIFKDIRFGKKCLPSLILENQHESEVFKNYLEKNNLSVKYVLEQCLAKLDKGEFTFRDAAPVQIDGNTALCYACALRKFKDLAYLFRFSIKKTDLPAAVVSRPDCHWGKNCRTQRHNVNHAQRFNHVCGQTRLT
ncbi:E3 ubiquitin-protein ligase CHFR-like isoform X2 [Pecten maximus]|uniref:E3 ubiquitin-protein ligase CHFR-like isoform X2 n=1 Tax=Pecten maximus TaxID=6579 RepID=UPI0014587964|nr:E3 ubiquitin-protein ligase CHFR-like isoform X2 [Pecten maximus]